MRPAKIHRGEDTVFSIATNIDMSAYTEIEFRVWSGFTSDSAICKLSLSEIVVSTTNSKSTLTVTLSDDKTDNLEPGDYRLEMRGTDSGGLYHYARFTPNRIVILPSSWEDATATSGTDYTQYG